MGLLDGMPRSAEDYRAGAESAADIMNRYFDRHPETPKVASLRKRLMAGETPAMIAGINGEEIDAILAMGGKFLKAGQMDQAKDWLAFAALLDPYEPRGLYMLGMVFQIEGDLQVAARLYINFIAFDATNPEGFLRLGECLLANGETEAARGCFDMADTLCEKGHGSANARDHAKRMLAAMPAQAK